MKALVTGGGGFIGSHLVRRMLNAGRDVRCIIRNRSVGSELLRLGVDVVYGDLSGELDWRSALEEVDEVYHLAGITRARSNSEYYRGNQ